MRKKKNVSITDIAHRLGVSVSTVSYVLNGKRSISEETVREVIDAAKELGYVPKDKNKAQRLGLLGTHDKQGTKVIGLSSPVHRYTDYTNYATFFLALARRARRYGYDILLLMHESGDEELRRVVHHKMVDGILLLDVLLDDSRAQVAKELSVPVVSVGYPRLTEKIWSVDLDFERMGKESIEKLASLGHEKILLLGGINTAFEDGSNYLLRYMSGIREASREYHVATESNC